MTRVGIPAHDRDGVRVFSARLTAEDLQRATSRLEYLTERDPLIGLMHREALLRWLEQWGDPYKLSIMDPKGVTGIDYGVYGVPETYVIDKAGIIRYKQIGPLTPEILRDKILPLVRKLNA